MSALPKGCEGTARVQKLVRISHTETDANSDSENDSTETTAAAAPLTKRDDGSTRDSSLDADLIGRKIITDTYGGCSAHGGARSAAYICRQIS